MRHILTPLPKEKDTLCSYYFPAKRIALPPVFTIYKRKAIWHHCMFHTESEFFHENASNVSLMVSQLRWRLIRVSFRLTGFRHTRWITCAFTVDFFLLSKKQNPHAHQKSSSADLCPLALRRSPVTPLVLLTIFTKPGKSDCSMTYSILGSRL